MQHAQQQTEVRRARQTALLRRDALLSHIHPARGLARPHLQVRDRRYRHARHRAQSAHPGGEPAGAGELRRDHASARPPCHLVTIRLRLKGRRSSPFTRPAINRSAFSNGARDWRTDIGWSSIGGLTDMHLVLRQAPFEPQRIGRLFAPGAAALATRDGVRRSSLSVPTGCSLILPSGADEVRPSRPPATRSGFAPTIPCRA